MTQSPLRGHLGSGKQMVKPALSGRFFLFSVARRLVLTLSLGQLLSGRLSSLRQGHNHLRS